MRLCKPRLRNTVEVSYSIDPMKAERTKYVVYRVIDKPVEDDDAEEIP
jgi:hypothetical protein